MTYRVEYLAAVMRAKHPGRDFADAASALSAAAYYATRTGRLVTIGRDGFVLHVDDDGRVSARGVAMLMNGEGA